MADKGWSDLCKQYQYLLDTVLSEEDREHDSRTTIEALSGKLQGVLTGQERHSNFQALSEEHDALALQPRFRIAEIETVQHIETLLRDANSAIPKDVNELRNLFITYVKLLQKVEEEAHAQLAKAPNIISSITPSVAVYLVPARGMPVCNLLQHALRILIGSLSKYRKSVQQLFQRLDPKFKVFQHAATDALADINAHYVAWTGLSPSDLQRSIFLALEPARGAIGLLTSRIAEARLSLLFSCQTQHKYTKLTRRMIRMARQGIPPDMPEHTDIMFALTQAMNLNNRAEVLQVEELLGRALVAMYRLGNSFLKN